MGLVKDSLDGDYFRVAWGVVLIGRGETRGRRRIVVSIGASSTLFYRGNMLVFLYILYLRMYENVLMKRK